MGCGSGKRTTPDKDEDGKRKPAHIVMEGVAGEKQTKQEVRQSENPTFVASRAEEKPEDSACKDCSGETQAKTHELDCEHTICLACAREQVEMQMKSKQGSISYYCRICNAEKSLVRVSLSCGCSMDVFEIDKDIRGMFSRDKIMNFNAKKMQLEFPACTQKHQFTYEDLSILYGKKAQKLDLYRFKFTVDTIKVLIEELNKQKAITDLILDQAEFRKIPAGAVTQFFTDLKFVRVFLMRCSKLDQDAFSGLLAALKGNQKIAMLDLFSTSLGRERVGALSSALATSFSLRVLDLSNNPIDDSAAKELASGFLKKTRTLTDLLLEGTGLNPEGMKAICDSLVESETIKKLSLSNILLVPDSALEVGKLIEKNQTIENLVLNGTFPSIESYASLSKGLSANKKIASLSLASNKMEADELKELVASLGKHKGLRVLDLGDNALDENGGAGLSQLVCNSRTLEEINLKCNFLGPKGIQLLMEGLKASVGVKALNLRKNRIENTGATHIASYLGSTISFLEDLDISSNAIGEDGGKEVVNAMKDNRTLKRLNLGYNSLEDAVAIAIAEMITVNGTLEVLNIEDNKITNSGAGKIAEALPGARGLHILNIQNNAYTKFAALGLLRKKQESPRRMQIVTPEVSYFRKSIGV